MLTTNNTLGEAVDDLNSQLDKLFDVIYRIEDDSLLKDLEAIGCELGSSSENIKEAYETIRGVI